MTLRTRVFVILAGFLAATLLFVWTLGTGGVLRPFIENVRRERVEVAVNIAEQVEQAESPRERFDELTRDFQVRGEFVRKPPLGLRNARPITVRGRDVYTLQGPGSPVVVQLEGRRGRSFWMVLLFRADLDAPNRRIALGMVILGLALIAVGTLVVQWMLRPLELASSAMERVADGDLSHRAPAGADAAGRMGSTFNRMADRVQGLVQGQRDLMAAVSHELRTPLTRMRLQAEMMREEGAPPARVDALERDILAVDGLVEELLESARLDQGVLALDLQPLLAEDLLTEALRRVDLGERPVTLVVPREVILVADHKRVSRVVTNLLSNVVRYTPESTPVRVSVDASADAWSIEVADSGPGVPPEALDRLFDPFFRVESSRSKRTGGLGLGLMLCRQIAEAHGGRITAANRSGGGLIVRLFLPKRS